MNSKRSRPARGSSKAAPAKRARHASPAAGSSQTATPRRPTRDEDREYPEVIRFRVTEEQQALFKAAAKRSGEPLSAWLRRLALEAARVTVPSELPPAPSVRGTGHSGTTTSAPELEHS